MPGLPECLPDSFGWVQANADLVVELERHQLDVQLRLALQNGQVEAADTLTHPLTDYSAMLLLDRSALTALHTLSLKQMLLCNKLVSHLGIHLGGPAS